MTNTKSAVKFAACVALCFSLTACDKKKFNPADGAPKATQPTETGDMSLVSVKKPDLFPLVAATQMEAPSELNVTGAVNPDVSREVPVISLASGRVIDIKTRLGNEVKKGQLLLQVQSNDITNAFDAYLKAVNDEQLANKAYVRAKDLYEHGAVPLSGLEQAEDSEKDAKADLTAAEEQLTTLGVNKNHPSSIVPVYAPISGVIISQNVTNSAAVGVTYSGRLLPSRWPISALYGFCATCTKTIYQRSPLDRPPRSRSTAIQISSLREKSLRSTQRSIQR